MMKKRLLLALTLSVFTLFSCTKESFNEATLVRDCTGTYLQIEGHDYLVCNEMEMIDFQDGDKLEAQYIMVQECEPQGSICFLFHAHSGAIEVTKMKW